MTTLRIVTLAGDPEAEALLAGRLGAQRDLDLVLRCVDRVEMLATIRGGSLDAIVSVGAPPWLDRQGAHEAAGGGTKLIGLSDDPLETEHLRLLGATLLPSDASPARIAEACRDAGRVAPAPLPSSQPSQPKGKIIAVWGPKGAPGRTTLAVELAAELASTEPETLLIDGDPYGGDCLQILGVIEELPTVVWAARMAAKGELDGARLALDLRRAGRSGPVLLPGLPRSEMWPEVSDYGWRQLLSVARASFRFTVCDVGFCLEPAEGSFPGAGEGRNRIARAAVREAERVVAVCRADAIGVKNFLWGFEQLRELGRDEDAVIIANRVHPSQQRALGDLFRKHLGKRPIAYIPDVPTVFGNALDAGVPVRETKRGSDVTSGIRSLAASLGARIPSTGMMARLAGTSP
ncbi:MAG: hypothetical protein M3333_00085 [Actinomycetota bacterium]|nr:hypothetical protein [Actinomycetota bacterium]